MSLLTILSSCNVLVFITLFRGLVVSSLSPEPKISTLCTEFKLLLLNIDSLFLISHPELILLPCIDLMFSLSCSVLKILPSGPSFKSLLSVSEQTISIICTGSLFLSLMFLISFRGLVVSLLIPATLISTSCTLFLFDIHLLFLLSYPELLSLSYTDFMFSLSFSVLMILPPGPLSRFLLSGSEQTMSTTCTDSLFLSFIEEILSLSCTELIILSQYLLLFLVTFTGLVISLSRTEPMISISCTDLQKFLSNTFNCLCGSENILS